VAAVVNELQPHHQSNKQPMQVDIYHNELLEKQQEPKNGFSKNVN
jgi:hypothetical protein